MRKIALILFLIFIYSRIPISHCYYSLWEQDIFVEKNDHILINITTLDGLVSDHILQTSGNIQITLVNLRYSYIYIYFYIYFNYRNTQMIMQFSMFFFWMMRDINVIIIV